MANLWDRILSLALELITGFHICMICTYIWTDFDYVHLQLWSYGSVVDCRLNVCYSHSKACTVTLTDAMASAWRRPAPVHVWYNHAFSSYSHTSCLWQEAYCNIGIHLWKAADLLSGVERVHCMGWSIFIVWLHFHPYKGKVLLHGGVCYWESLSREVTLYITVIQSVHFI